MVDLYLRQVYAGYCHIRRLVCMITLLHNQDVRGISSEFPIGRRDSSGRSHAKHPMRVQPQIR